MHKKILGVELETVGENEVLEKIKKYIKKQSQKTKFKSQRREKFLHIISLNPENLVIAYKNANFKGIVRTAQIRINDGVGVIVAGRFLGMKSLKRVSGVDLMEKLLDLAYRESLKVMLIGGKNNLAESLADCYRHKYPKMSIRGIEGIKNINHAKRYENEAIFSIVRQYKPHLIFAAFGTPVQEEWFEANSSKLDGIVCMGVGGAFDFLGGRVKRAPVFLRRAGLEWLYRLILQPWRWRRQLRLVEFGWLVFLQKLNLL